MRKCFWTMTIWVVLGMPGLAYNSAYIFMAVTGFNGWSTSPNMTLVDDYTWRTTSPVTLPSSGEFKFTADNDWGFNWGGTAAITRVPAQATAILREGNLGFSQLTAGSYHIFFNEQSGLFEFQWAGASPLPVPSVSSMSLVGSFNEWTVGQTPMTRDLSDPHQWSCEITVESTTTFQFSVNDTPDGFWGSPTEQTVSHLSQVYAAGNADFSLTPASPSTYSITLNVSNNIVTVTRLGGRDAIETMTVVGNFIVPNGSSLLGNMERLSGSTWQSEHYIATAGTITLYFAANLTSQNDKMYWDSLTSVSDPLPVRRTLVNVAQPTSSSKTAIPSVPAGRYRITFDHVTGVYTFQQIYAGNTANLIQNPGFESSDTGWGTWQSASRLGGSGNVPHTGNRFGEIRAQWAGTDFVNYGSYSQDVTVQPGKAYQISAWVRATADWTPCTVQFKAEWLNGTVSLDQVSEQNFYNISTDWQSCVLQATAPTNATRAHVVFLTSEMGTTGGLHLDDVEMRITATRYQDFETWGAYTNFGAHSPDWSVSNGKVTRHSMSDRPLVGVLISKYIEGTGNNKAIEIYNGTTNTIDLSNYVIQQYDNGATNATVTIPLTGMLAAESSHVLSRPAGTPYPPATDITVMANQTSLSLTFNGDDVIVLRQGGANGTVLDHVGQVGAGAATSYWRRATTDRTLTRNPTVHNGNTNLTENFNVSQEWITSEKDDFSNLGSHVIDYGTDPYAPTGYGLLINSGAYLMSGYLPEGIGSVSFWYHAESESPAMTYVIETSANGTDPWTEASRIEGISSTNFAYYSAYISQPAHGYVRFRHEGTANRLVMDNVQVELPSDIRRIMDFNDWTSAVYTNRGTYSKDGWSILDSSISTNWGALNTRAAVLENPGSMVLSPSFETGLGIISYWLRGKTVDTQASVTLQLSQDGGTTWNSIHTSQVVSNSATTNSVYSYVTNAALVRFTYEGQAEDCTAILDNINIAYPQLYRNQNFNGWPTTSSYSTGEFQGWWINNMIVDTQNAKDGKVGRFRNVAGSYLQSPYFPDGIGSISFSYRSWSASANAIQLQVSANGTTWQTLTNLSSTSTTYTDYNIYYSSTNDHYVRFSYVSGAQGLIDDISIAAPTPRPSVSLNPYITPTFPSKDDSVFMGADIVTRYGADILSVTGRYRIASDAWKPPVSMTRTDSQTYTATTPIPPVGAGVTVSYIVTVVYAGIGAAPNSIGYSIATNQSAIYTYTPSSISKGSVWINEIVNKATSTPTNWFEENYEDSEFVELCGIAGSAIGNWKIELALGEVKDVSSGTNVYATYTIPVGTVLADDFGGHGFYVLGDSQMGSSVCDQFLTVYAPATAVSPGAVARDHIYNGLGVIRLRDEMGNIVYSLSTGYSPGSTYIPSQTAQKNQSISLTGTGSYFDDFGNAWVITNAPTPGAPNTDQTLVPPSGELELLNTWHIPSLQVVPTANTNNAFYMRDPITPEYNQQLSVSIGFHATYMESQGILHIRPQGETAWTDIQAQKRDGSLDQEGNFYIASDIAGYAYGRGQNLEYILEVRPSVSGFAVTFIGTDEDGNSTTYRTSNEASVYPFRFAYAITSDIEIANMAVGTTTLTLTTTNNDLYSPFRRFRIYSTTNLQIPYEDWITNSFQQTKEAGGNDSSDQFLVPRNSTEGMRHYRVNPLWP